MPTGRKLLNIEYKLVLFFLYLGFLVFLLATQHNLWTVLCVHLLGALGFSLYYFGREFLLILIAPITAIVGPIELYRINRYIKKFNQNTPADVAIILGHSDWSKLEAWIKPNSLLSNIKPLIKLLETKKQAFSFYPKASAEDVEKIMGNKNIKEVYLLGHGSSHLFQLNTDNYLYYCEFNNPRYGKEFVHQIHCGTPDGKSLVDYVVPIENKEGCFFIRKSINSFDIEKELNKRIKDHKTK